MKEYSISLNMKKRFVNAEGEKVNDVELLLQVWQDLRNLKTQGVTQQEDDVVSEVLTQILTKEFKSVDKIPMPKYYENSNKENTNG